MFPFFVGRHRHFKPTLSNISRDSRCEVHQAVLGIRETKEGWFDLYCPGGIACEDDGDLYSIMVSGLVFGLAV